MIISTITTILNFRFPLKYNETPSFLAGCFCFKCLKINILQNGDSPPAFSFFPKSVQESIQGAAHRMRPILLTATVAVFGLFPASISTGIGSDVQRPLATVIVYGLLFATVVTLFVLPTLYYLIEKRKEHE